MDNLLVSNKKVTVENGEQALELELKPLTFARFAEMKASIPDREIEAVVSDPSPIETAILSYNLLTADSKARLSAVKIQINDMVQEASGATKLYYFISETSVEQGYRNLLLLTDVLTKQIKESLPVNRKKKVFTRIIEATLWVRKKFLTWLPVLIIAIPILILLKMLPLHRLIDSLN